MWVKSFKNKDYALQAFQEFKNAIEIETNKKSKLSR
jgi:hypothetical protein